MYRDIWIVLQWWGALFLVGAVAWPLTKKIFGRSMTGPRSVINDWIPDRASLVRDDMNTGWWDGGYLFSKAVGMAAVTWIVFVMGTIHLMPFTVGSIGIALGVVFAMGLALQLKTQNSKLKIKTQNAKLEDGFRVKPGMTILIEEIFFLTALLVWSWVKGHEPSIRGLEKFMDYGFMQSILNSAYFPPADMWYAPLPINYYYFGHMVTAVLTRLSGLELAVTFNLMLATIFALTLTMSFSIGMQISRSTKHEARNSKQIRNEENSKFETVLNLKHLNLFSFVSDFGFRISDFAAGLLTSFLVTLAGNMQTIYAFTRGYTGENVKPFWELGWGIRELGNLGGLGILGIFERFWGKIGEGMNTYWYANATRFIPYTIHEFPSYSFVVSDVHGHVLSLPFVLLAIAMLIHVLSSRPLSSPRICFGEAGRDPSQRNAGFRVKPGMTEMIFYGFLVGVLLMTNALDGPIYFALAVLVLVIIQLSNNPINKLSKINKAGIGVVIIIGAAILTSLPFLIHFKSFVAGLAVNCPPGFLANMKFGPILFEGVEKCQRSPIWMWLLLWGFFVYIALPLLFRHFGQACPSESWGAGIQSKEDGSRVKPGMTVEKFLLIFFGFALVLVIVPEVIYFKDIYPAHFRSNTMFKLGYQAYILFSIVSAYSIVTVISGSLRMLGEKFEIRNPKSETNPKPKILNSKRLFLLFLLPQLFLVSIYPIFSVRSYFGGLKKYEGLDGLGWLRREYPGDWRAIQWLNQESARPPARQGIRNQGRNGKDALSPNSKFMIHDSAPLALVEADGDSYTDYARVSAFTGIPTIIGWPVHEWLWRGTYDVVAPRREDVRQIYESEDVGLTVSLMNKYSVRYVIVGTLEREKYKSLQEWKFTQLGREVFRSGGTVVYEMRG